MKRSILFLFFLLGVFTLHAQVVSKNDPIANSHMGSGVYNITQAVSEKAQLNTISFDCLAFLTGNFGADCFFPPGKVADYFGFQYMRDNDSNSMGHNTDFLTRIANNVIEILNTDQLNKLIALANEEAPLYQEFAQKRIVLIQAFSQNLENKIPLHSNGLNKDSVIKYCSSLYAIDARLSYRRAEVMSEIIKSFSAAQKEDFKKLDFNNSATWPILPEKIDKRSLSHRADVALMTFASELFSWYKGSEITDTYFCPERHGTYFGGFYLKDYPAMGNQHYSISTSLTANKGQAFLEILQPEQRKLIDALPVNQQKNLDEIVSLRMEVSHTLRKFLSGEPVDENDLISLCKKYGEQDGELSYCYAVAFQKVNSSLTAAQKTELKKIRNQDQLPGGIFEYSDPVQMDSQVNSSFLF